jgi:hypothetical protein
MLIAIVRVVNVAVEVPAPKGRIRLVGGGLVLSNMAVKVPALLSSKVLAP